MKIFVTGAAGFFGGSIAAGLVRHVGRGLNIWSNVHIDDMD